MLTRDAILGIEDRKLVAVSVPEWGGDVYIRPMSGSERDSFEGEMINQTGSRIANIRARMAVRVVCDDQGTRLFTDAEAATLGEKSAAALDRIFAASQKINRIGDAEVDAEKKDSPAAPSAASGSNSPATSG